MKLIDLNALKYFYANLVEVLKGKADVADTNAHIANKTNPHEVTKAQIGLGNVENKSSETIRSELTSDNVTGALGFTPLDAVGIQLNGTDVAKNANDKINISISADGISAISYATTQTLTEAQKKIARENIGAGFPFPDEEAKIGDTLFVVDVSKDGVPTKWSYRNIMDEDISNLTYDEIAAIVRTGRAEEKFKIGDQIITTYTNTEGNQYEMPWDIVAFRNVELEDGNIKPGMIIQSHYATIENIMIDAAEPNSSDSDIKSNGWNRWRYSAVRQWLNSDKEKGQWWAAQHSADAEPVQLNSNNGFMKGLPADFLNMLKPTKHETALNYVFPSGAETTYAYDITYDTFFIPSMREEHFQYSAQPNRWDGSDREGTDWEYWIERKGSTPQDYGSSYKNANAIRYSLEDRTTLRYIWLRSAFRNSSSLEFNLNTSGYISASYSLTNHRVAPAAVIC